MSAPRQTSVLGKRAAATSVRPIVREAALLCLAARNSPQGVPEMHRLARLASGLGLGVHDLHTRNVSLCDALESMFGDEWRQAVREALAEEQRVQVAQQEIRSARQAQANAVLRQANAERIRRQSEAASMMAATSGASLAASLLTPQSTMWERLPWELRLQMIEQMVDVQPRDVVALYQTSRAFHDAADYLTHPFYEMQESGAVPTQTRIPLIEYARLAANFGAGDPLQLFMAMALCVVRALANIILHNVARASYYPSASNGTGDQQASTDPGQDLTAPVAAALGGDVAYQLAQWYAWVAWYLVNSTDTANMPIHAAVQEIYGRIPLRVFITRSRVGGFGHLRRLVTPIGPVSSSRMSAMDGDDDVHGDALWIMTPAVTTAQLGRLLSRQMVEALFGPLGIRPTAVDNALARMAAPDAQQALETLVNDYVTGAAVGGGCVRATRSSSRMPAMMQLNSGLTFIGFTRQGAFIDVNFRSRAIEWALSQSGFPFPASSV